MVGFRELWPPEHNPLAVSILVAFAWCIPSVFTVLLSFLPSFLSSYRVARRGLLLQDRESRIYTNKLYMRSGVAFINQFNCTLLSFGNPCHRCARLPYAFSDAYCSGSARACALTKRIFTLLYWSLAIHPQPLTLNKPLMQAKRPTFECSSRHCLTLRPAQERKT